MILFSFFGNLQAQTPPADAEVYVYKAVYLPASDKDTTPQLNAPEGFMAVPNEKIIARVKSLNCNTGKDFGGETQLPDEL